MKRKIDDSKSYSNANSGIRSQGPPSDSQKMIFVEEEANAVPLGTHHGGSMHTYMSHKVQKLQELHQRSTDEIVSGIFRDCVVHVNGATDPSLPDIRRLITMHGGHFAAYQVSSLTHIVCDHFTDAQLKRELQKSKPTSGPPQKKIIYVQAKWVVDSIKREVRLPESEYLPRGLKDRFGGSIKDMFANTNTTSSKAASSSTNSNSFANTFEIARLSFSVSSSSSKLVGLNNHSRQQVENIVDLCSPADSFDDGNDLGSNFKDMVNSNAINFNDLELDLLTSSQQDFMRAVPDELRQEVFGQLRQRSNNAAVSNGTAGVSLIGDTQLTNTAALDYVDGLASNNVPRQQSSGLLDKLQDSIDFIHGQSNEDNGFAIHNHRRERMMRNRLESWLQLQLQLQHIVDSSNYASSTHLQLIESYAIWLLHGDQLEQLKWLMKAIENQTHSEHFARKLLEKLHSIVIKQYGCILHI